MEVSPVLAPPPCLPSYQDSNWSESGFVVFSPTPNDAGAATATAAPSSWRSSFQEIPSKDLAELIDDYSSDFMMSQTGLEAPRSNSVPADMFSKTFDAFTKPSTK